MKRTFIAVEIESSKELFKLFSLVKNALFKERINWADENNLHLTLNFLGEISSEMEDDICNVLKEVTSGKKPFKFNLKGIGVFPTLRNPRILWIGAEGVESLCEIQADLTKSLANLGLLMDEKPFKAHLTLGRIKQLINREHLERIIEEYKSMNIQRVDVNKIILFESVLTSRGPIYNPIEVFELNE